MTETNLTPAVAAELDSVLLRSIEANEEMRAAQRDYDSKRKAVSDLDEAARRLRLSLFALEGRYDKKRWRCQQRQHPAPHGVAKDHPMTADRTPAPDNLRDLVAEAAREDR